MTAQSPTALVADDEPLLRDALVRQLGQAWPDLRVVAQARNGREAVEQFEALRPDIGFLDVHMPGLSGIDAARQIGRRAHLVFITAFDHYAVEAFAQGVLDYLVKPVEPARLAETVTRLRERLAAAQPAADTEALLQRLAAQLQGGAGAAAPAPLRWIRAQVGQKLRLIAVDDIDYLRSDAKYTLVAWRGDAGEPAEALVRTPLKDLIAGLDPDRFAQIHRAYVVNYRAVSHVARGDGDSATIHLKGRPETLPVSRGYLHLFRQM
jgi:DNA-binding LytR/AlgR family response regulator